MLPPDITVLALFPQAHVYPPEVDCDHQSSPWNYKRSVARRRYDCIGVGPAGVEHCDDVRASAGERLCLAIGCTTAERIFSGNDLIRRISSNVRIARAVSPSHRIHNWSSRNRRNSRTLGSDQMACSSSPAREGMDTTHLYWPPERWYWNTCKDR